MTDALALTPEIQVNDAQSGQTSSPNIVGLPNGKMAMVWVEAVPRGDQSDNVIVLRILNHDGSPAGEEIQIHPADTTRSRLAPQITVLGDDRIAVVWNEQVKTPGNFDSNIKAQVFDLNGVALGGDFAFTVQNPPINGIPGDASAVATPEIFEMKDGRLAAIWEGHENNLGNEGITLGTLDPASPFNTGVIGTINPNSRTRDFAAETAQAADGSFGVIWLDESAGNGKLNLRFQHLDANGARVGGELLVTSAIVETNVGDTDIIALTNGSFVVAYLEGGKLTARLIDEQGTLLDGKVELAALTTSIKANFKLLALSDGGFLAAWSVLDENNLPRILAQAYGSSGVARSAIFEVGADSGSGEGLSNLVELADGRVAFVFSDTTGSGDSRDTDVHVRIFDVREEGVDIVGNFTDDSYQGTRFGDRMDGTAGNDLLQGMGGNDLLLGDEDLDVLQGGDGADTLDGGTENDRLSGEAGKDSLIGGDGLDLLFGGAEGDVLNGGDGRDDLNGGDGQDRLLGGLGNDLLKGGSGRDTMSGQGGADDFVFANKLAIKGDRIEGFQHKQDDIDLRAFMRGGDFIGGQAFHREDDEVRYIRSKGLLQGDINGDGKADWSMTLANKPLLTDADFIF